MRIPKCSWAAIGSLAALLLGYIFDEAERKEDDKKIRRDMQAYIDKKFEELKAETHKDEE